MGANVLEKLLKGNPDRDRLYTNLANPMKKARLAERAAREAKSSKEPKQQK